MILCASGIVSSAVTKIIAARYSGSKSWKIFLSAEDAFTKRIVDWRVAEIGTILRHFESSLREAEY